LEAEKMQLDDRLLKEIAKCLVDIFSPYKVIEYGDYACGEATENSEIVIAVIIEDDQSTSHEECAKARLALRQGPLKSTGLALDLLMLKRGMFELSAKNKGSLNYHVSNGIEIWPGKNSD
jgi:hypothetical protein